jgi:acetolactate synthase-1/2/3 large subunit
LEWLAYVQYVRDVLPVIDTENATNPGFACPYRFAAGLSELATGDDVIVICSSGGANSVPMQVFQIKHGQSVMVDSGLASMGVGLGHAIGAAFGNPGHRVLHIEGDGGFCQNLQELAIVDVNRLPIKMAIWANSGYGSIRTTQRNYFGGAYLGCDTDTGLGFPDWEKLFDAFNIPVTTLDERGMDDPAAADGFASAGPHAFIVPIDPEQSYWPKITSRVTESGSMESNPLYLMSPDLPEDIAAGVTKYLS